MPAKAIAIPEFWKERIDRAKERGMLHLSVFDINSFDEIDATHQRIIRENIPEGANVLDVGCGYGRIAKWFDPDRYLGIDFSKDFIEEAGKFSPEHTFVQVDVLQGTQLDDKEFDWAVCVSIRQMVRANLGEDAWEKMLAEIKRVADHVLILEYSDADVFEIL